jgi:hypothetical protein
MGFALRPGLHFCEAASAFIFLDLEKDRYFRLPARLEDHFRKLVDDPLSAGSAAAPLIEAGVLRPAIFRQSLSRPRLVAATTGLDTLGAGGTGGFEVTRALASDINVSQQLRLGRLAALIASYENSKVGRTLATPIKDDGPVRVVRAYETAKLFRASANRCLSRSLAMARRLAGLRCDALLVIGVRAQPFAAHAWVQSGDIVLNETPDEVSRYTPIFFA